MGSTQHRRAILDCFAFAAPYRIVRRTLQELFIKKRQEEALQMMSSDAAGAKPAPPKRTLGSTVKAVSFGAAQGRVARHTVVTPQTG
jgi:hypothetical protein